MTPAQCKDYKTEIPNRSINRILCSCAVLVFAITIAYSETAISSPQRDEQANIKLLCSSLLKQGFTEQLKYQKQEFSEYYVCASSYAVSSIPGAYLFDFYVYGPTDKNWDVIKLVYAAKESKDQKLKSEFVKAVDAASKNTDIKPPKQIYDAIQKRENTSLDLSEYNLQIVNEKMGKIWKTTYLIVKKGADLEKYDLGLK